MKPPHVRAVLLSLALLSSSPAASAGEEPRPDDVLRAAVRALRRCDLEAFQRVVAPPSDLERQVFAWADWIAGVPEDVGRAIDAFLARSQALDATETIRAELEPELPRLQQAWREGVERVAARLEGASPWLVTDPAVRQRWMEALAAARERALALDLADPARAAKAVDIAVHAARALRVSSFDEVRSFPLDETLRRGNVLLVFVKQLLANYDVPTDRSLGTLVFGIASGDDETATVEVTFKGPFEHPAPLHLDMRRVDRRWVPLFGETLAARTIPALLLDAFRFPERSGFELAGASSATPFEWGATSVRPIVHVLASGEIRAGGESAAAGGDLGAIRTWLAMRAMAMDDAATRGPVLVHADARAPFERVAAVMTLCSAPDVALPDVRLAVARADDAAGAIALPLPVDGADAAEAAASIELRSEGGVLECVLGGASVRERGDLSAFLARGLGTAGRSVVLAVGPEVTVADVVAVLDACAEAGVSGVGFAPVSAPR